MCASVGGVGDRLRLKLGGLTYEAFRGGLGYKTCLKLLREVSPSMGQHGIFLK